MAEAPVVTIEDQIACVERELALRQKHYPRWVKTNKLTAAAAELELVRMRAVLGTLVRVASGADLIAAERARIIGLVRPFVHSSALVRLTAKIEAAQ